MFSISICSYLLYYPILKYSCWFPSTTNPGKIGFYYHFRFTFIYFHFRFSYFHLTYISHFCTFTFTLLFAVFTFLLLLLSFLLSFYFHFYFPMSSAVFRLFFFYVHNPPTSLSALIHTHAYTDKITNKCKNKLSDYRITLGKPI